MWQEKEWIFYYPTYTRILITKPTTLIFGLLFGTNTFELSLGWLHLEIYW